MQRKRIGNETTQTTITTVISHTATANPTPAIASPPDNSGTADMPLLVIQSESSGDSLDGSPEFVYLLEGSKLHN